MCDDLHFVREETFGTYLMRGESSFLDWREQTYPRWMEPVDIYEVTDFNPSPNDVVFYQRFCIAVMLPSFIYTNQQFCIVVMLPSFIYMCVCVRELPRFDVNNNSP